MPRGIEYQTSNADKQILILRISACLCGSLYSKLSQVDKTIVDLLTPQYLIVTDDDVVHLA